MSLNSKRMTIMKLERRIRSMDKRIAELEDYAEWSKRRRKALRDSWNEPLYPEPVFIPAANNSGWLNVIWCTLKESILKHKGTK